MNSTSDRQRSQTIQEKLAEASYDELVTELERHEVRAKRIRAEVAWLRAEIAQRDLDDEA